MKLRRLEVVVGARTAGRRRPGESPRLPRSITRSLGPQSSAISANDTMWSFFEAHPLPS